jgi:hypothetical protein
MKNLFRITYDSLPDDDKEAMHLFRFILREELWSLSNAQRGCIT